MLGTAGQRTDTIDIQNRVGDLDRITTGVHEGERDGVAIVEHARQAGITGQRGIPEPVTVRIEGLIGKIVDARAGGADQQPVAQIKSRARTVERPAAGLRQRGESLARIDDSIVVVIDISGVRDAVVIEIILTEIQITDAGHGVVARAVRHGFVGIGITIGIRQGETRVIAVRAAVIANDVVIVDVVSGHDIESIIQPVAVAILAGARGCGMPGFNDIQPTVVVGIGIDIIGRAITIGIDRRETVRTIVVVQAVAVGITKGCAGAHAGGRFVAGGGLGLDVVGDAVVIGVDIQIIGQPRAVGVTCERTRFQDKAQRILNAAGPGKCESADRAVQAQ